MSIEIKPKAADSVRDVISMRYGSTDIDQVIRDSVMLWNRALMHDSFNRENSVGLGANWTNLGPSEDPYYASVIDGTARLNIPDNLIGLNLRTSNWRWNPQVTNGDDGYIEARVANKGNTEGGLQTIVWRRANNTGTTLTGGVGIRFAPEGLQIVKMVGGTLTPIYGAGAYSDGDICRLIQVGDTHRLLRNGTDVSPAVSDNTPVRASTHRSMAVTLSGLKPGFAGRRFSASLDYVECR